MIVAIPFCEADQARAERLCDLVWWMGQNPVGHCLVVAGHDVHPEFQLKVRLAAEVAFHSVDFLKVTTQGTQKFEKVNSVFRQVARHIFTSYKEPWLWLEADCVPVKPSWLMDIFQAYHTQPKRYMGRYLMVKDKRFMSRVGVYPVDAINDLEGACNTPAPFERVVDILPRATHTRLIHMEKWDPKKPLPDDVIIVNGDRTGQLVEQLIEKTSTQVTVTIPEPIIVAKRRGRPRKVANGIS